MPTEFDSGSVHTKQILCRSIADLKNNPFDRSCLENVVQTHIVATASAATPRFSYLRKVEVCDGIVFQTQRHNRYDMRINVANRRSHAQPGSQNQCFYHIADF